VRAFVDTSTLFKKYVDEKGSQELEEMLEKVSDLTVSPITWVELNHIVARRLRGKSVTAEQSSRILSEAEIDFRFYSQITWNEELVETATQLAHRHPLKTLDAIQLASGLLSEADVFLTSDRRLFEEARKVTPKTRFIG